MHSGFAFTRSNDVAPGERKKCMLASLCYSLMLLIILCRDSVCVFVLVFVWMSEQVLHTLSELSTAAGELSRICGARTEPVMFDSHKLSGTQKWLAF